MIRLYKDEHRILLIESKLQLQVFQKDRLHILYKFLVHVSMKNCITVQNWLVVLRLSIQFTTIFKVKKNKCFSGKKDNLQKGRGN